MTSSDEILTVESFLFICKEVGLSFEEIEMMDIGGCLDYIQEWVDTKRQQQDQGGKTGAVNRKATQADFDAF